MRLPLSLSAAEIAAIAAVASLTLGLIALGFQVYWRRPQLRLDFGGSATAEGGVDYSFQAQNEGDSTVRNVQAEVLLDGKPVPDALIGTVGPTTLAPHAKMRHSFRLPKAAADGLDPRRLSARVCYGRWRRLRPAVVSFNDRAAF